MSGLKRSEGAWKGEEKVPGGSRIGIRRFWMVRYQSLWWWVQRGCRLQFRWPRCTPDPWDTSTDNSATWRYPTACADDLRNLHRKIQAKFSRNSRWIQHGQSTDHNSGQIVMVERPRVTWADTSSSNRLLPNFLSGCSAGAGFAFQPFRLHHRMRG